MTIDDHILDFDCERYRKGILCQLCAFAYLSGNNKGVFEFR